jgi:hypothetical protein
MSVNNPVDLAPVLAQLQQALTNLNTVSQQITTENAAITQELQTQTSEIDAVLESLTTVNGELDNTATAVNQHTSDKALEITQALTASETEVKNHVTSEFGAHTVIKSIQRGETFTAENNTSNINLGNINVDKSIINAVVVRTNPVGGSPGAIRLEHNGVDAVLYIGSSAGVEATSYVSWEVIEYA